MTGRSAPARLDDWIERHRVGVLVGFSIGYLLATCIRAWAKPFWHDEIFTLVASKLPSVGTLWTAQRDGLDLSPPLNTLLTRAVQSVTGVGRVASRLPPMIGFWVACLALFAIVRQRATATLGLAAAVLPCFTAGYHYAYESRGYGLTIGFAALALYTWSEAAAGRRRSLHLPWLAVALAAGIWSHYFAVLAFAPIVAGETVRDWRARRVDWGAWIAIAVGALWAVPLLPLAAAGDSQAGTFWGRAAGATIAQIYVFLFLPVPEWGIVAGWAFMAALVIAAMLAVQRVVERPRVASVAESLPVHERVAAVTVLALPILGWLLGRLTGTGSAARYLVFAVVGIGLVLPIAVWRLTPRHGWRAAFASLLVLGWFGQSAVDGLRIGREGFRDPVRARPLLVQQLDHPEPLVMTNGIVFLQCWYYATPEWRGRVTYLDDPAEAFTYAASDTIDRGLLALKRWAPVSVQPYRDFIAVHREFRVYGLGAGWLLDRLRSSGATVDVIGREADATLYNVHVRSGDR